MNENLLKSLSKIISKIPKSDLESNLSQAKEVIKNSNKEDLSKLLSNPKISKLLGKDADNLKEQLKSVDLDKINLDELENKIRR